ncbi:MAG: 4'-phosphopantetheinyl transferase superfamily protein [Ferruginibacter sp.]
MPLVYQQNINEATKLAVWHIAEEEVFFLKRVSLQKEITHPHKRLQHLAGRYLLTELFDNFPLELIQIADTKKPFLPNEAYHFSISHCGDYAAVIVSSANRVGTDIEIVSEKVGRIRDKFLTAGEQELVEEIFNIQRTMFNVQSISHVQLITLCWSIKEAMFKWYGLGKVDFKEHLRIDKIDVDKNEFIAHCIFKKDTSINIIVKALMFSNNVLTWTVT